MLFQLNKDHYEICKYLGGIKYNLGIMKRSLLKLAFTIGEDNIKSSIQTTYDLKLEYNNYDPKAKTKDDVMKVLEDISEHIDIAKSYLDNASISSTFITKSYAVLFLCLEDVLLHTQICVECARKYLLTSPIYTRNRDVTSRIVKEVIDSWHILEIQNVEFVGNIRTIIHERD